MAAPAKFLFDMDFGAPDKTRERPATPSEIAQKIAAAEARAYRDGFDAGQREAKAESDRRTALVRRPGHVDRRRVRGARGQGRVQGPGHLGL